MKRLLFLLIFGVTGTGILLALGTWQIQRLAWKQGVLADIETRIADAPVDLPANPDPDRDRYLPVQTSGNIGTDELHVLVSVKRVGAGYRIIAPFITTDGRTILLDRGFVPDTDKAAERATGATEVIGNLHWPEEVDSFTPEPDQSNNIWFARDVPKMAAALGTEPVLLIAKSKTDPNVAPLPVDTAGIPNDHLQYAITWFSLALIWAAMTGFFLRRGRAKDKG